MCTNKIQKYTFFLRSRSIRAGFLYLCIRIKNKQVIPPKISLKNKSNINIWQRKARRKRTNRKRLSTDQVTVLIRFHNITTSFRGCDFFLCVMGKRKEVKHCFDLIQTPAPVVMNICSMANEHMFIAA